MPELLESPTIQQRVHAVRDRLIDAPDTVCLERARLITDAWQTHEHEPLPVRRALALAHVLANMTLDVATNPFIAGNTSSRPRAFMLCPEYGVGIDAQVLIENDGLDGLLDHALPADIADYWADRAAGGHHGVGHLAVDLDRVVNRGLASAIEQIDAATGGSAEQQTYRRAMRIACQAVIDWAHRYADAAQAAAASCDDPAIAAAHRRVAAACRHVPARPARNLFEGLQAIALVHLAIHIEGHGLSVSIGSPDRVLDRFVDEAHEPACVNDIAAFALCIMANSVQGRGSKTQAVTVGGRDAAGRDRSNALTLRFCQAWDLIRPNDPHLFLRWHAEMDPAVRDKAVDMLCRGVSMPLLIHDEPTAAGFINAGVSPDDAFDYCVIGCNELGIPARLAKSAAPVVTCVYPALLDAWLRDLDEPRFASIDALFDAFADHAAGRLVQQGLDNADRHAALARHVPTPFTSSLFHGCIEAGQDFHDRQPYDLWGIYERGLTDAANALAAIEHVVYIHREHTLADLLADLSLRRKLLAAPKVGNDDDHADRWVRRLIDMRRAATDRLTHDHGQPPYLACHVIRSLHRLSGSRLGPTLDGRAAGEPLADSIGARAGTAAEGPTAMLNSVLKIDAARDYPGGYNLNLTLSPGSAQPNVVAPLVHAFFNAGGQELQINTLDLHTLRDAREHPQRYRDLVVRIAGFNALWCKLSHAERDEIIARAVKS